ncbi:MAG: hypothetical protein Q8R28_12260 [Dehalococcoidia bacterium]|nr:hypothetical protein [Dehalococcoidia bacterium]
MYCEQRQAVDILQRESSYCAVSLDDRIAAAQAERDAERAAELEPEPHVWPTDFEGP